MCFCLYRHEKCYYYHQPQRLRASLSVAIDVSQFACDKIVETPTSKKVFTQWSSSASRFLVSSSCKKCYRRTDDGDNSIHSDRRPYLYSGLPVFQLRHELPWAVRGPFELTSNREALQDTQRNTVCSISVKFITNYNVDGLFDLC